MSYIESANWRIYDWDTDTFAPLSDTHACAGSNKTACGIEIYHDANFALAEVQPINCKRCLAILKETGQS
jgi:hypothetical protein